MKQMKECENSCKYYADFKDNDYYYIIMEKCDGDLTDLLKTYKNGLPENLIKIILKQLNKAFKMMKNKNIIHRDLKPQNIFFNKDNHIKIGDFSFSKQLINTNKAITRLGSENYIPEIINNQSYDYRIDIWNLGIILYELTQLKHPFEDNKISIEKKINNILKGKYFDFSNINYSPNLLNLIKDLIKVNPNERKNIDEIILECYKIKIKKNSNSKNE